MEAVVTPEGSCRTKQPSVTIGSGSGHTKEKLRNEEPSETPENEKSDGAITRNSQSEMNVPNLLKCTSMQSF